jgi:hypothetical protein
MIAALITALPAAPAGAAVTVSSVHLDVPARPGRAAASLRVLGYSLDATTTLVSIPAAPPTSASRLVVMLPARAWRHFATTGSMSYFPWLAIRQRDRSGANHRTVFRDVTVTRVERLRFGGTIRRRVTFIANEVRSY